MILIKTAPISHVAASKLYFITFIKNKKYLRIFDFLDTKTPLTLARIELADSITAPCDPQIEQNFFLFWQNNLTQS